MRRTWKPFAIAALMALAGASVLVQAQQPVADIVLTGGKIITVDEKFSIAQAVAIRGARVMAVGTNQQINALAGPNTRRIDLRGRSVMPGFIDNHAHFQEEGAYWMIETRLDGILTRKEALVDDPGAWPSSAVQASGSSRSAAGRPISSLDDQKPFTRDELDKYTPNNPVFLQFTREAYYLNSKAIEATGMEKMTDPEIQRDAKGRATGFRGRRSGRRPASQRVGRAEEHPDGASSRRARPRCSMTSPWRASPPRRAAVTSRKSIERRRSRASCRAMRFFCMQHLRGAGEDHRPGHRRHAEAEVLRRR